jgi:epsin
MSKVVRSVKNVTKGYTTSQVKVRNGKLCPAISSPMTHTGRNPEPALTSRTATSNDAWGPVGSDMQDIAQMTYAEYVRISLYHPLQAAPGLIG